jgi:hypothetical protein
MDASHFNFNSFKPSPLRAAADAFLLEKKNALYRKFQERRHCNVESGKRRPERLKLQRISHDLFGQVLRFNLNEAFLFDLSLGQGHELLSLFKIHLSVHPMFVVLPHNGFWSASRTEHSNLQGKMMYSGRSEYLYSDSVRDLMPAVHSNVQNTQRQ